MKIVSKSAWTAAIALSLFSVSAMGQTSATTKKENSQQTRMATCNADAKTKSLQSDARKNFMSSCLKKS